MNIAYLMNTYPLPSTTFIRREIHALERRGLPIKRYALRRWQDVLVDPADKDEVAHTSYILSGNVGGLIRAFIKEIFTNPGGLLKAFGPWWSLLRGARGGLVRHMAYLFEAIYFRQCAAADEIDHVHVHFLTNATAVAMLSRIMGGPTYSATVHGPDELTDAPLLDFPAKIQHASFIAAITSFCKSQLIRFGSIAYAEKIKIVRCALDLRDFAKRTPIAEGNHTFVCVGRLCPQKGQVQIPSAVAELRDEFPKLKVILVGDGESRHDVEVEIARCGVGDLIELKGWCTNDEVHALVSDARVLLLPSYAEGLPVVIMEALALERPVISTYIAGIPELVDEGCGWIIPAGSQEALVDAMRSALSTSLPNLNAKGAQGRARIEQNHDVDKEAAILHDLFERAVSEEKP